MYQSELLRQKLKNKEIRISLWSSTLLVLVILEQGTEIHRIKSDKGIRHVCIAVAAYLLDDPQLVLYEKSIVYPLSIVSTSPLDYFFINSRYIRIYIVADRFQIDAHQVSLPEFDAIPGLYYKRGIGKTFGAALRTLLKSPYYPEIPVTQPT